MISEHNGHSIVVASYGQDEETYNVAMECEDCHEVLLDRDVDSSDEACDLAEAYRKEAGIL